MFKNKKRIDRASKGDIISIPCKERIKVNSKCLKTTDNAVIKKVNNEINNNTTNNNNNTARRIIIEDITP